MIKQLKEAEYVSAAEALGAGTPSDYFETLYPQYAGNIAVGCFYFYSFLYLYGSRLKFPWNWSDCTRDQSWRF